MPLFIPRIQPLRFLRNKAVLIFFYSAMISFAFTFGANIDGGKNKVAINQCLLDEAEKCFDRLFEQMPVCDESLVPVSSMLTNQEQHNNKLPPITFRCQHFNVLDSCFRESSIVCLPTAIGHTAKISYRKRLGECSRHRRHQIPINLGQDKKYRNAQSRRRHSPFSMRNFQPLTELQFISLFGYLQTQCRRIPTVSQQSENYLNKASNSVGDNHLPNYSPEVVNHNNNQTLTKQSCAAAEFMEIMENCEVELRQRSSTKYTELDRHQLLRMKLDVSSKLMHYGETNRDEECLIVRSTLAEVFLIHQKYCFQTTVTKCLCERLNFEKLCEIGCSNLEPQGMAFDQRLTWKDYRGRLVSDSANRIAQALPFMMLFALSFSHSYHCLIL